MGALGTVKGDLDTVTNMLHGQTDILKQAQDALKTETDLAKKTNNALASQLQVMNQELAVLREQSEKQNQRPAILVFTQMENKALAGGLGFRQLYPGSFLNTGHSLGGDTAFSPNKMFLVRNIGNDWLRRTRVMANVVSPAHLLCVTFQRTAFQRANNPCEPADTPQDLPPDPDRNLRPKETDLFILVHFSAPTDLKVAEIYFTVDGDNLVGSDTYSVTTDLR